MLRVVHISDMHCGPEFLEPVFLRAVDEINRLDPDVVVVSGDMTENGLLAQYRLARKSVDLIECRRKIFCSGNHDYRSTGYLLFRKFFPSKPVTRLDGCVFAVVSTARPERNAGEVGHRQVLWLERSLRRYMKENKIVVMHHHLIQVPDTGPDNIPVLDAGDTLRGILQSKTRLVLAGHRHRPWRWKVGNMDIIHAGTVSSERLRGFYAHSYNVIDVRRDSVNARVKVVDSTFASFSEVWKSRVRLPA